MKKHYPASRLSISVTLATMFALTATLAWAHQPAAKKDSTPLINMSAAYDDEAEEAGKFDDDKHPLAFATHLQAREFEEAYKSTPPKAEDQCYTSKGTRLKSSPWDKGFYEGVAGQRYVIEVKNDHHNKLTRLDRKACQDFRKPGADPKALRCCIQGHLASMPILIKKLVSQKGKERQVDGQTDPHLIRCYEDFHLGHGDGVNFCRTRKIMGCPTPLDGYSRPIRYMGCYTLGYAARVQKCTNEEEKASNSALGTLMSSNQTYPFTDDQEEFFGHSESSCDVDNIGVATTEK